MREKLDPEITKAVKEIKIAAAFLEEIDVELLQVVEKQAAEFMIWVKTYSTPSSLEAVVDPTDRVKKLAKQVVDVYRLLARLNAVIEVKDRSLTFFMTRPRIEVKMSAKLGYSFGKAYAYLGVCWEDIQLPMAALPLIADHFIRALKNGLVNTQAGYDELVKIGLEENP